MGPQNHQNWGSLFGTLFFDSWSRKKVVLNRSWAVQDEFQDRFQPSWGPKSSQKGAWEGPKWSPKSSPDWKRPNHKICNTSRTKTLIFRVQGLQNRTPNLSKIGSKSHLRRGGLQKASGEALGALLEASGAKIKKLGTALGRVGPKKGTKTGAKMGAKSAPRYL